MKPEPAPPRAAKRDHEAGARRARVIQVLVTQGGIVAILLALAFFSRDDPRMMAIDLALLLVPFGLAYAVYTALVREEAARREGRWTKEAAQAERKRGQGIIGAAILGAAVLALLAFVLL